MIGLIGCIVLSVGIAFFVSMLFDSAALSSAIRYGLGFVITALLYLVTGAITILVAKRRLAKQRIIPEIEAKRYEEKLKKGNYLVAVHTDESEDVDRAEEIFKTAKAEDVSTVSEASAPKA